MTPSNTGRTRALPIHRSQPASDSAQRLVHVHARLLAPRPGTTIDSYDWHAAGLYETRVLSNLSDAQAASCAIDGLFMAAAFELSKFEFSIHDGVSGQALQCDASLPRYALADACTGVQLVGPLS